MVCLQNQSASQLGNLADFMLLAPGFDLGNDLLGRARVPEAGGAHLDGGRAGQHELDHIGGGGDAAHADDGNLHRLRRLIDHAYSNRLNRGAGKSGGDVGDPRLAGFDVNRHGDESVHQRNGVRPGFLGHVRHLADAGHVRRELYDEGPLRQPPRSGDYLIERPGIAAELDAAVRGVGAGNIQLVSGNALAFVQDFQSMFVVFTGVAENIGDDHDVFDAAEFGKLVVHEGAGPDVLQADGVQHSGGGFIQARRRVADQGLARKAFDHESAQPLQVDDVFKFHAVAEGAAGGEDRVLQRDSGKTDTEIGSHAAGALVVFFRLKFIRC